MKVFLATRLKYSKCFITRWCHLIEQLSRIIKWHAPKVENLLTPAQIDTYRSNSFIVDLRHKFTVGNMNEIPVFVQSSELSNRT